MEWVVRNEGEWRGSGGCHPSASFLFSKFASRALFSFVEAEGREGCPQLH